MINSLTLKDTFSFQERQSYTTITTNENGIKSSNTENVSDTSYKPVDSIKTFQPLQPFRPFSAFEAPTPFEGLKSFELVKQAENSFSQVQNGGGELPEGYEPVKPLSPLKFLDLEPIFNNSSDSTSRSITKSTQAEIKEENIKNTLKEIILDLDHFVERDKELTESREEQLYSGIPRIVVNGGSTYAGSGLEQVSCVILLIKNVDNKTIMLFCFFVPTDD